VLTGRVAHSETDHKTAFWVVHIWPIINSSTNPAIDENAHASWRK